MTDNQLNKTEQNIFNVIKNEIMQKLEIKINNRLMDAIIALRGNITDANREEIKDKIISKIEADTKRFLEL